MRYIIAIGLLASTVIYSISLNNVINQKNTIIENQEVQIIESQNLNSTYQSIINSQRDTIFNQYKNIKSLNVELNQAKDANKHFHFIGNFLITYYDLKYESCNKNPTDKGYGITKSGMPTEIGISCATDISIIPIGSYIYIDSIGCRIAQDTGGAIKGNHIDIFVNDFSYDKYKTHYSNVYLIK